MNFNFAGKKSGFRHRPLKTLVGAIMLSASIAGGAYAIDKIIPIGEWAEHINVELQGQPLFVHLRTGYERTVLFPEPVKLHSINKQSAADLNIPELQNCRVNVAANVLSFEPLKRFKQQELKAQGLESGRIYTLVVSSSPNGKRQPIEITK